MVEDTIEQRAEDGFFGEAAAEEGEPALRVPGGEAALEYLPDERGAVCERWVSGGGE